jgi:hypothetical protein
MRWEGAHRGADVEAAGPSVGAGRRAAAGAGAAARRGGALGAFPVSAWQCLTTFCSKILNKSTQSDE